MSGKLKVILAIVITLIISSGIWVFILFQKTKSVTSEFQGQIAQLTATLDALGPNVTCYTVTEEYSNYYDNNTAGQMLQETSLQLIDVPHSLVGDAYVTNSADIVGKYCKINIQPGTPITSDLLMAELYDDTLRDVDVLLSSWVVGMREGDYVDIRIQFPYGEDYVVLPHKRVQSISERTVKMYLTEEEQLLYNSAMVDYYLNSDKGTRMYLTKYIEPGVQPAAQAFYAPSTRVQTLMLTDPNIVNRANIHALSAFRPAIDNNLNQFITERDTIENQTGKIASGRDQLSSDIMSDYRVRANEEEEEAANEENYYFEDDTAVNLEGVTPDPELMGEDYVPPETEAAPETEASPTIEVTTETEAAPMEEVTPETAAPAVKEDNLEIDVVG